MDGKNTGLLERDLGKVIESINLIFDGKSPNYFADYDSKLKGYNWIDLGNEGSHKASFGHINGNYRMFWETRYALESALKVVNGEPLTNQDRFNLDSAFLRFMGAPEYVMQHAQNGFEMEEGMTGYVHTSTHKFNALFKEMGPEQTCKFRIAFYLYGNFELGYDKHVELSEGQIKKFTRVL